ncbi:MAG: biotin/lipoyl-binding protein, partial [Planctomycetota bacterium]
WLTVRWIDQGELIVLGESKQPIRIAATRSWLVLESWLCRLNAKPGRRSASRLGAHSPLLKAAVVAAVIAGLAFFPMTIKVPAQGRLTPLAQQSVFAPTEGVITAVHFTRGQRVHAGDPLFELSSHDLSLRQADVVGKLLAAQEQLAVSIARRGDRDASASHVDRRVIEVRIEQLENQLRILEKRRDELTVRSPIDGIATVVLEHTLENLDVGRPVQGGQAIARVLQPESGYQLLLEIDDCDAGYVARAHAKSDVPLQCNYRRRSDPTRTYQASLKRLNESVHVNETGQRVLEATLAPTDADHQGIPESGVVGWIQSESRPAGFVLFRRVIQTLRMRGWI